MKDTTTPRVLFSSEREDVRAARNGRKEAFDRLVLRYQSYVFNTARALLRNREDALDVTQEVFLKAYCGLAGFRLEASFKTWIFRITLNSVNSFRTRCRAQKRSAKILSLDSTLAAGKDGNSAGRRVHEPADHRSSSSPVTTLENNELMRALQKAIADLAPEYRKIIVLRDVAGESYEDIALAMNAKLGTVKSKLHRARRSLQAKMVAFI